MFPELRKLPYLRRLEYLKLWTLEERITRADLIEVYKSNLRHHFFSDRVINNWKNLDNKTATSGSVNIFKGNLERQSKEIDLFVGN